MITCLSPNGEKTSFDLESPPLELLVGSATGVYRLARDSVGEAWREVGKTLTDKHIGALVNAPGGWLFASCHHPGGVYRSRDGGITWEQVAREVVATDIYSLAVIDTATGPAVLLGIEPVNLFRSDDFGESWVEQPAISTLPGAELWTFPPPPHVPHLKSMAVDRTVPETFYACVEQGALLKTEDAGRSWRELDSMWTAKDPAYRDAHRMVVAPWNPKLLVFAAGIGVYRSTDGGETWEHNAEVEEYISYPDALVASASDRTLYVCGSKDVPGEWLLGSSRGNICRSDDEGRSWVPINQSLEMGRQANLEGLSVANYPGGYLLFLGDTDGKIFTSDDRGETWTKIATTGPLSKGGHYKVAQMREKLPVWARMSAGLIFTSVMKFTGPRAATKRKAEFANRAH